MPAGAAFYFDLSSPLAYLAAEQALAVFASAPEPVEWIPVSAAALPGGETFEASRCQTERDVFREEVERRACELGLQPLRWPEPFPFDGALAMRVATYAKSIGRTVPFAQAAFRQAFAGGRSLAQEDSVLIAAAACEMHPAAVLRAASMRSVAEQLAGGDRGRRRTRASATSPPCSRRGGSSTASAPSARPLAALQAAGPRSAATPLTIHRSG